MRIRHEAEEQRLREEKQKQLMLDEVLAKRLQKDEERQFKQQIELEEKENQERQE